MPFLDGLDRGENLQILLHAAGDLVEDLGALGRRDVAPGILRLVRGVKRKLDACGLRANNLAYRLAGDRADILEVTAVDGSDPLAADEVLIAGLDATREFRVSMTWCSMGSSLSGLSPLVGCQSRSATLTSRVELG